MLDHGTGEPLQITLVRRLVGLLRSQRWILLGQLPKAPDSEVQLNNQRLLRPQRAVIVEDGDSCGGFDVIGSAFLDHPRDKVGDGGLRRAIVPTRKLSFHLNLRQRAGSASRLLGRC
jgi:hypothetical protein